MPMRKCRRRSEFRLGCERSPGGVQPFLPAGLRLRPTGCPCHHRANWGLRHADLSYEAIPFCRHGLDMLFATFLFAERLAQHRQVMGEIALLDDRIGPDSLE